MAESAWRSSSRRSRMSSFRRFVAGGGEGVGANNAIRELGGVFGVAVLASIFASYGGYESGAAYVDGLIPAVWVGAAVVLLGALAPCSFRAGVARTSWLLWRRNPSRFSRRPSLAQERRRRRAGGVRSTKAFCPTGGRRLLGYVPVDALGWRSRAPFGSLAS